MKRFAILILCIAMSINLCGCGKGKQVEAAEAAIEAIGEVTLESGEAIEAARTAYDALKPRQQEKVENYAVLTDAEAVFGTETAIDAIGEVTIDSGDAVEEARNAYDALTPEQQKMVNNADELYATEGIFKAETAIEAIGEVTLESGPTIEEARSAYDALTPEQQEAVKSLDVLTTAEEEFEFAQFYEENRIKNYKTSDEFVDVAKDWEYEELYEKDRGGAMYYWATMLWLDLLVDDEFDPELIGGTPYIGINYDGMYVEIYDTYADGIIAFHYENRKQEFQYGTVKTELPIGDYMAMMEQSQNIDAYHKISSPALLYAANFLTDQLENYQG